MSTSTTHPSSIYIGAVIAIVALSTLGVALRLMAIRRARATASSLPRNAIYTPQPPRAAVPLQRHSVRAARPASTHSPNRFARRESWNQPAPPYTPPSQPPTSPPPASPRFNPPRSPPPPSFPVPQPAPTPHIPRASPLNPPVEVHFPTPASPPRSQSTPTTLMERMREVQSLMLEIHRLESDTSGANNRARIQELQRRVTELSDVEGQDAQAAVNPRSANEPPPYDLDGRQGP